ncbi:hypothetical protein QJS66_17465 [Kocuria rhizophila]|nr:hypothetical protein QJS66_17465 [Kocuria rhizophila]
MLVEFSKTIYSPRVWCCAPRDGSGHPGGAAGDRGSTSAWPLGTRCGCSTAQNPSRWRAVRCSGCTLPEAFQDAGRGPARVVGTAGRSAA